MAPHFKPSHTGVGALGRQTSPTCPYISRGRGPRVCLGSRAGRILKVRSIPGAAAPGGPAPSTAVRPHGTPAHRLPLSQTRSGPLAQMVLTVNNCEWKSGTLQAHPQQDLCLNRSQRLGPKAGASGLGVGEDLHLRNCDWSFLWLHHPAPEPACGAFLWTLQGPRALQGAAERQGCWCPGPLS